MLASRKDSCAYQLVGAVLRVLCVCVVLATRPSYTGLPLRCFESITATEGISFELCHCALQLIPFFTVALFLRVKSPMCGCTTRDPYRTPASLIYCPCTTRRQAYFLKGCLHQSVLLVLSCRIGELCSLQPVFGRHILDGIR